ncbi:4-hydroxy-3-methylbut-2-enyl diphosphate reductase [Anaerovibrio lipolyticus DSM 3074]|uniref:4-hydroxy-3-methylbut-2-enyl diphosphate reductase n=1 Tax=Anaerovibrio lipolyticus DSM 3074 TaxID=1120997 RepID=A0A1M6E810_9FIRM|nr:4-hydroxy-3-methylbut-2-enyl diphosphate reductase [Anaerovibrio lipolyticus]SHI81602.1 4-hydroxy-3-methylbut-2-enyl diphosphate reductase [Anaerovibrio lipolyticus DSM 3074]
MEVILADNLGFCYGVKRAIQLAEDSAAPGQVTNTLGPIIHNPQMVAKLAENGVGTVDSLDEVKEGTIIIRSHGVGPKVYDRVEAMGLNMVDATCPHVRKAQSSARMLADEGYQVVIIGEKRHPEVKSIIEWAGDGAVAIETEEEADSLPKYGKLGVVAQTTFSAPKFKLIVERLLDKSSDMKILRTICTATDQRQSAAMKLATEVDLMIVIGGKNSANTTRLAQLCSDKCKTYHIETAEELRDDWFDKIKKIGITAGASTPDWIIKEVYKKCQKK